MEKDILGLGEEKERTDFAAIKKAVEESTCPIKDSLLALVEEVQGLSFRAEMDDRREANRLDREIQESFEILDLWRNVTRTIPDSRVKKRI